MINSRNIDDLHPHVAKLCVAFIAACKSAGIDALITSTYRDAESQAALYAQGRTTPGHIVTNAKPGQSFHNYRCAFDFVPIVNGKAIWKDDELFEKCGVIAEGVGLEWAGRWHGELREMAHCQWTGGLKLADLQAGAHLSEVV